MGSTSDLLIVGFIICIAPTLVAGTIAGIMALRD